MITQINIVKEPEYYYPAGLAEKNGLMTYQESQKLDSIPTPSNIVTKSSTAGLLKNDGTVDTNSYVKESDIELEKTATGNPITLTDAVAGNAIEVSAEIVASQSGSGTPSPTNIRPISGFSSVTITREDAQGQTATVTVALGQTVYGGTLDLTSGELTIDKGYAELVGADGEGWNWSDSDATAWFYANLSGCIIASNSCITDKFDSVLPNPWNNDSNAWTRYGQIHVRPSTIIAPSGQTAAGLAEFKTWLATNHLQVVYTLATPTTTTLTAAQLALVKGQNTLTCNSGDMSLKYLPDNTLNELYNKVTEETDTKINSLDISVISKKRYTITASNWSNSVDANGYYTYTITLSNPTLDMSYPPEVNLAGADDNTFYTDTEAVQYSYIAQCNLTTSTTLVLYAKTKPESTFYVFVTGLEA